MRGQQGQPVPHLVVQSLWLPLPQRHRDAHDDAQDAESCSDGELPVIHEPLPDHPHGGRLASLTVTKDEPKPGWLTSEVQSLLEDPRFKHVMTYAEFGPLQPAGRAMIMQALAALYSLRSAEK